MAHNYAKPLTAEARIARVMSRIGGDWGVRIERPAGGAWRVALQPSGKDEVWSAPHDAFVDALEEAWRACR